MDVLVESTIVLEVKSVRTVTDVHHKQLVSYLKLTKLPLGLLINFNVNLLRDGITRLINLPRLETTSDDPSDEPREQPAHRAQRGGG